MQLSDAVQALIRKARIVSFASWSTSFSPATIERLQTADDEGRYLTDTDLEALLADGPHDARVVQAARLLRDEAPAIVSEAREQVLAHFPGIAEAGGDLYPQARADACWRDFWHFLRCISYGVAAARHDFTSSEGLHYMGLLYQELRVPLPAMLLGLESLKKASLQRFAPEMQATVAPCFEALIVQLRPFEQEE